MQLPIAQLDNKNDETHEKEFSYTSQEKSYNI